MSDLVAAATRNIAKLGALCGQSFAGIAEIETGPGRGLRVYAVHAAKSLVSGTYECPVQDALVSLVKRGAVCYDVGANLGFFSMLFSRLTGPAGTVFAFEPVPGNAAMIEKNARLNRLGNIKVLRLAVSRADGRRTLLLARHSGGAVLEGAGVPPDPSGHVTVDACAIDTLVERRQIEPPAIVKIDVEGAELDVLQGMEMTLRAHAPAIVLEVDDEKEAECENKLSMCRSLLGDLDYRVTRLPSAYPDGRWFVRHLVAVRGAPPAYARA